MRLQLPGIPWLRRNEHGISDYVGSQAAEKTATPSVFKYEIVFEYSGDRNESVKIFDTPLERDQFLATTLGSAKSQQIVKVYYLDRLEFWNKRSRAPMPTSLPEVLQFEGEVELAVRADCKGGQADFTGFSLSHVLQSIGAEFDIFGEIRRLSLVRKVVKLVRRSVLVSVDNLPASAIHEGEED